MRPPITAMRLVIGAVLTLGVGGCLNSGDGSAFSWLLRPRGVRTSAEPTPNSPSAALRLLEWSYNNKAISGCRDLFTADYRFYFSPLDSAGVAYRETPWVRDDELISTTHLFVGGTADQPPASSISLSFDRTLLVQPDPRFVPWDPAGRWHKRIRTQVGLNLRTSDGAAMDISGAARFYLVRGDSAAIPADLVTRGFRPDSTRWWIGRWDDETLQAGPTPDRAFVNRDTHGARRLALFATQPTSLATWGRIKLRYR